MIYDELTKLIFSQLPRSWGFHLKSVFAGSVIDIVREHIQPMVDELAELDKIVSQYAPADSTLRIKFATPAERDRFVNWFSNSGVEHYVEENDYDPIDPVVDWFEYHLPGCVYGKYAGVDGGDMILASTVSELSRRELAEVARIRKEKTCSNSSSD